MHYPNLLFQRNNWYDVERGLKASVLQEISEFEADYILGISVDELVNHLDAKYRVEVPELKKDEITVDQKEIQIDMSDDPYRRSFFNDGRSHLVIGTQIEVSIPFEGNSGAFYITPTTFTSHLPEGKVEGTNLILKFSGQNLDPTKVRAQIDQSIQEIESYLTTLRANASGFNSQLPELCRSQINQRRSKLTTDKALVSSLGYKLKERANSPKTFEAPTVRRKFQPASPPKAKKPADPEPVLSNEDYEHILNVIQNMAQVMERSPYAFKHMSEEDLRTHFLVQLNGQYEGQASGETFNYQGKTDIFVRSGAKNVFIAECKFWTGPKAFLDTFDQLLGYSSWRDTKVAILLFNKNKDATKVLESISAIAKQHPNFKREISVGGETTFRFIFKHRDDPDRELTITVLVFNIPS